MQDGGGELELRRQADLDWSQTPPRTSSATWARHTASVSTPVKGGAEELLSHRVVTSIQSACDLGPGMVDPECNAQCQSASYPTCMLP